MAVESSFIKSSKRLLEVLKEDTKKVYNKGSSLEAGKYKFCEEFFKFTTIFLDLHSHADKKFVDEVMALKGKTVQEAMSSMQLCRTLAEFLEEIYCCLVDDVDAAVQNIQRILAKRRLDCNNLEITIPELNRKGKSQDRAGMVLGAVADAFTEISCAAAVPTAGIALAGLAIAVPCKIGANVCDGKKERTTAKATEARQQLEHAKSTAADTECLVECLKSLANAVGAKANVFKLVKSRLQALTSNNDSAAAARQRMQYDKQAPLMADDLQMFCHEFRPYRTSFNLQLVDLVHHDDVARNKFVTGWLVANWDKLTHKLGEKDVRIACKVLLPSACKEALHVADGPAAPPPAPRQPTQIEESVALREQAMNITGKSYPAVINSTTTGTTATYPSGQAAARTCRSYPDIPLSSGSNHNWTAPATTSPASGIRYPGIPTW